VPLRELSVFEEKLGAKTILESGKGHFGDSDNIKELPVVLDSLLNMSS